MSSDRLALGTKCCVPRLPEPVVERPHLEKVLADGERLPVTLVSGPPGAGKTTLLASWVRSCLPGSAAWLSLDTQDNQSGRLAALVTAALADAGWVDPGVVDASDRPLDAALEDIRLRARPCVLVLDDVHELSSRSALDALAHLVARVPAQLDLVLSSRADPPVGLARLRLDDRLAEVRYTDLCFSPAEAADLFASHGLELSESHVRKLCGLVEGWAAGLRLAAAALQSEPEPAAFVTNAAATQAAASDYLLGEVLAREDDTAQDFLLRTSVADRLTADLAVALTGDQQAGERLADLQRRGLFLVELDDRECYRYHALFRALLQARLRQHQPAVAEELHRRAATWYLDQGLPAEAEDHARAGGDWRLVGRLVLRRWLTGTTEATDPFAAEPLAAISPDVILRTPELSTVAAAEACRWANREDADLYRSSLERTKPPTGDDGLWETARLLLDLTFGWTFGADERSLAAVESVLALDDPEPWTPRLRQLAVLAQAEMDIDGGDLDSARLRLEALADNGEPQWHRILAGALLAVLDAASGNLPAAEPRLAWVQAQLDADPAHPTTTHLARAAAALCAAQRGQQRGVAEALGVPGTLPPTAEWSSASLRCVDRVLQAAIRGQAPFFVSLDARTARHPLAARALVALGVLEVIDAKGRPIPVGGPGERAVTEARQRLTGTTTLARLRRTPAAATEVRLDPSAPRHPRTALEAAALAAIAAERQGDHATADRLMGEALDLSTATGIRAPLLDHASHLERVLERTPGGDVARTATALGLLDRLHHERGDGLVEPLTDREVEVLQHLPTMMSNAEIAYGLHLSVNTVKTHLKSVYRKLGVDGRRDAVLRGRELELL